LSNFFGVGEGEYGLFESANTLLIRKKESGFYRTYLLSSDINELHGLLSALESKQYVFNIPSKKGIDDWNVVFQKAGYTNIGVYNRYYTTKIKYRKSAKGDFATQDDIAYLEALLTNNFSVFTDYLPTQEELGKMIDNKQVLVSRGEDGKVLGLLIYTLEGKKCYFNVWIDNSGNGLFLLYKAYNIVVDNNIGYVYFWVKSTNYDVIKLHITMGAKADGLVDYTFIKQ